MSGQFGGSSGECAYMLTYRLQTHTPSCSSLPAVSIPWTPALGTPIRGKEGNGVDGENGSSSGWREGGTAVSDARGAPNDAAASELTECVAEKRNGDREMRSLPPHLQTLVHEANEELRRWVGWGDVKHLFYVPIRMTLVSLRVCQ